MRSDLLLLPRQTMLLNSRPTGGKNSETDRTKAAQDWSDNRQTKLVLIIQKITRKLPGIIGNFISTSFKKRCFKKTKKL